MTKKEIIENQEFVIISVLDITKEQRDESRLFEQNQKLKIVRTLQNDFISAKNDKEAFVSFLDSIVMYAKSSWGFMGEVSFDKN